MFGSPVTDPKFGPNYSGFFTNFFFFNFTYPRCVRVPKVEDLWSRQCGSLDVSQLYRPPRPVTEPTSLLLPSKLRLNRLCGLVV
jgi:hypothetical protein